MAYDPEVYQSLVGFANRRVRLTDLPESFQAKLDDEDRVAYGEMVAQVKAGQELEIPEGLFG